MSDPFFWNAIAAISALNALLWFSLYREHRRGVELFVVLLNLLLAGVALCHPRLH